MPLAIKDGTNAAQNLKTTLDGGDHVTHHNIDNLPADPATEAKQDTIIAALTLLLQYTDGLEGKDFATQTTLASLLAKVIAAPATEAKQDTGNTSLSTIAAKDFATQTTLALLNAKDFATQTTLAALLAKVIAAPATEAKQDTGNTSLSTIAAKDFATQTTLASLLAKVIAAPATEAKQDTLIAKDFATQTTLAALLAKVIAAPATEAKQDTGNTSLGSIDTKIPAKGPASPANSLPVNLSNDVPVVSSAGQSIVNTDLLTETVSGWYDASNFHSASFQIIGSAGISSGQIFFEQTNDTTNAAAGNPLPVVEHAVINANPIIAAFSIAASTIRTFIAPITARYVRVRISTVFAGGTIRSAAVFSQMPFVNSTLNVQQVTAGNFNVTATVASTTANEGTLATPTASMINSAATTNGTSVKASAGTVYSIAASNINAAIRYLKFYNKASAPTVGTDVPVLVIPIPAGGSVVVPLGKTGLRFATGIALAITASAADSDTTAVAASEIKVATSYI